MEDSQLTKLIEFCSSVIEYRFVKGQQILFKVNEKADNFYIIFDGIMEVLKPTEIKIKIKHAIILLR